MAGHGAIQIGMAAVGSPTTGPPAATPSHRSQRFDKRLRRYTAVTADASLPGQHALLRKVQVLTGYGRATRAADEGGIRVAALLAKLGHIRDGEQGCHAR